jgi:lipoprotein-anchoring transpeptidase ErfK/SrfK
LATLEKINQTVEVSALYFNTTGERVVRPGMKSTESVMARMFASPRAACSAAAGAAIVLIASHNPATSQALDPGWQLVYAGQPGYGDGLMESVFGDSSGEPIAARAFQPPEPLYSEADPAAQPSTQESAPAASQQLAAAASTQHTRSHRPAPAYYRLVPAQQARGGAQGPVYYYRQVPGQAPAQVPGQVPAQVPAQSSVAQPAPASGWQAVPQPHAAAQPVQRYTGTASPVPARSVQSPSAGYRMAAAPQPQTEPQYTGSVPAQQARGLFSANYQVAAASQAGSYRPPSQYQQQPPRQQLAFGYTTQTQQGYAYQTPVYAPSTYGDMAQQQQLDPRYERQVVEYRGSEKPGTIIIDTPHFFLYLVMDGGRALRYGIGVGRPGFTWAGVKTISAKREWPDWRPPDEMLVRRPDLPHFMPGGPDNPLGARALYLGSTLYRIHGSNEPWSIGTQVSSGCIRLRNEDIIDLYGRVKVGAKVIVI